MPDLLLINFYKSLLIGLGATISNNPIFSGIYPYFLIFWYFNILARWIMSSSSGLKPFWPPFLLCLKSGANLSFITLIAYYFEKIGGLTI